MRLIGLFIISLLIINPVTAQLVIEQPAVISGSADQPKIIKIDPGVYDVTKLGLKVIDIDEDTLVYLPPGAEVLEYTPTTYVEKSFENDINDYIFKGAFFYPALFVIAGIAYASKK